MSNGLGPVCFKKSSRGALLICILIFLKAAIPDRAVVAESVSALYSLERYHTQGRGFESGRYLFSKIK